MNDDLAPVVCHHASGCSCGYDGVLDLAVIVPTYNERDNVSEMVRRLADALVGLRWEVIFVDDDSPDGTSDVVRALARTDRRIRLLQRVGRRGLSSACIEGALATSAEAVAVIDGDLQHDETVLPEMLGVLRRRSLDIVIGSRHTAGGDMKAMANRRVLLSEFGRGLSYAVCRCNLSDPMSGFFVARRSFLMEVVHGLAGNGFKILVDIFASSRRPVQFAEVGYSFRERRHGESKLDTRTGFEYLLLICNKLLGNALPMRFVTFGLVGSVGIAVHLACLTLLIDGAHQRFVPAQLAATCVAMITNFFLNNVITYRDRALRGARILYGLVTFCLACSFGAWANFIIARHLFEAHIPWYFAGLSGILLSSVWNYSVTTLFTWQEPKRTARPVAQVPDLAPQPQLPV